MFLQIIDSFIFSHTEHYVTMFLIMHFVSSEPFLSQNRQQILEKDNVILTTKISFQRLGLYLFLIFVQ